MVQFIFSVKASSTILNPYFCFPSDRIVKLYPPLEEKFEVTKKNLIVEPCKISLPRYRLIIMFNDDEIIFFKHSNKKISQKYYDLIHSLLSFIIFKTFMHYNLYSHSTSNKLNALLEEVPDLDIIKFNLGKIVKKEVGGKLEKGFYYDVEPYSLLLKKQDIEDFLSVLNINLNLAIYYYLNGCYNIRYFLIDYYKSIEAIRNYFKNEKVMKEKLRPYNLNWKNYNKLKRYANDTTRTLNIGRHAPKKGEVLYVVDVKRLLEDPKSKEIFEESSRICRGMIDIFIRYLK